MSETNNMNKLSQWIAIITLLFAVGFNLHTYRYELDSLVDPNDNAFQFALVNRTNTIWDFASSSCPKNLSFVMCHLSFLVDHWVPNWAQGYNLPYYYSHIPQILIVASYRAIQFVSELSIINYQLSISLFQYYHFIIYILFSLFPLSLFLAFRILKFPWMTAGFAALLASQISTKGLYGIDPSSFTWGGWGLSSQLFALIWLPLALAYAIKYVISQRMNMSCFDEELKFCRNENSGLNTGAKLHLASGNTNHDKKMPLRASSSTTTNGQPQTLLLAILFLTATTAGHLGIGMMAFLALAPITFTPFLMLILTKPTLAWDDFKHWLSHIINAKFSYTNTTVEQFGSSVKSLFVLAIPPIIILSYWIVPAFLHNDFHNVSVWDPIWKFNSYGAFEILTNLFSGNLFDYNRFPIFTILVGIGLFLGLLSTFSKFGKETKFRATSLALQDNNNQLRFHRSQLSILNSQFSILFLFFLLLYFGNTTWGGILNIIPGMSEFHQHRFIVGVHIASLFLAPLALTWIIQKICNFKFIISPSPISTIRHWSLGIVYCVLVGLVYFSLSPRTLSYARDNASWLKTANEKYMTQKSDIDAITNALDKALAISPQGRVYALRGNEGKNAKVADSSMYMYLSTLGYPTVLWLPETWSPNSDTEQFFIEENPYHYALYNIRYVVAPVEKKPQSFWSVIQKSASWILYSISIPTSDIRQPTSFNYITPGTAPSIVFSNKTSFTSLIHLWLQSEYPKIGIYPELRITNKPTTDFRLPTPALPHFAMIDEVTYQTPDDVQHNLFAEIPGYSSQEGNYQLSNNPASPAGGNSQLNILSQSQSADMIFTARVEIRESCPSCVLILKQTFHPSWVATVNGKKVKPIIVFPFFTAIRLEEPGIYDIYFSYEPSLLKKLLAVLGILFSISFVLYIFKRNPTR